MDYTYTICPMCPLYAYKTTHIFGDIYLSLVNKNLTLRTNTLIPALFYECSNDISDASAIHYFYQISALIKIMTHIYVAGSFLQTSF